MTTPDPTSLGMGKAITNPSGAPAADVRGATYPSSDLPAPSDPIVKSAPGLTMGFSAAAAKTTVVQLPFMELPVVGFVLAAIAGLMNAFTLIYAGTFATVQSGNVAASGIYLATMDGPKWLFAVGAVVAFGLGSFLSGILMAKIRNRQRQWSMVLLSLLGLLTAALALTVVFGKFERYEWIALGVSFIAGAMGNAYHKDNNMLFGAVAVTFVVQMAFNFLAQSLFRRKGINGVSNLKWSGIFFSVLLGFALGAMVGAGLIVALGTDPAGFMGQTGAAHLDPAGGWALMAPALLFFTLAGLSKKTVEEGDPADPTDGGLIG